MNLSAAAFVYSRDENRLNDQLLQKIGELIHENHESREITFGMQDIASVILSLAVRELAYPKLMQNTCHTLSRHVIKHGFDCAFLVTPKGLRQILEAQMMMKSHPVSISDYSLTRDVIENILEKKCAAWCRMIHKTTNCKSDLLRITLCLIELNRPIPPVLYDAVVTKYILVKGSPKVKFKAGIMDGMIRTLDNPRSILNLYSRYSTYFADTDTLAVALDAVASFGYTESLTFHHALPKFIKQCESEIRNLSLTQVSLLLCISCYSNTCTPSLLEKCESIIEKKFRDGNKVLDRATVLRVLPIYAATVVPPSTGFMECLAESCIEPLESKSSEPFSSAELCTLIKSFNTTTIMSERLNEAIMARIENDVMAYTPEELCDILRSIVVLADYTRWGRTIHSINSSWLAYAGKLTTVHMQTFATVFSCIRWDTLLSQNNHNGSALKANPFAALDTQVTFLLSEKLRHFTSASVLADLSEWLSDSAIKTNWFHDKDGRNFDNLLRRMLLIRKHISSDEFSKLDLRDVHQNIEVLLSEKAFMSLSNEEAKSLFIAMMEINMKPSLEILRLMGPKLLLNPDDVYGNKHLSIVDVFLFYKKVVDLDVAGNMKGSVSAVRRQQQFASFAADLFPMVNRIKLRDSANIEGMRDFLELYLGEIASNEDKYEDADISAFISNIGMMIYFFLFLFVQD
jgi:hypothetical protein